ncbi:MAG: serine/threonine protein phosphatase [Limimaricola sp.]|uniref:metallophosphoesterase n=1 Tax=Limimaricola sp. TaxID=2211665 RepID=UPI001DC2E974|nr:metallophosphoesterase [Limimaricola sp.]MBI1417898.1 serine/threonine protein phosphatase [Limimaricola sp.]
MMGLFRADPVAARPPRRFLKLPALPAAIYAVGDIHGCIDQLRAAEARILADGADLSGQKLIIALGDVIDRGPDSAAVMDHLSSPAPAGFTRLTVCGNHEDMFLRFLDDPPANADWLDFGGAETLRSYGVKVGIDSNSRGRLREIARDIDAVLPRAHRAFLEDLPLGLLVGDICFAHAAYDFGMPPEKQSSDVILWGRGDEDARENGDGLLVHGHYVVDNPEVTEKRINIDTGAYMTGRLSTLKITGPDGSISFL